MAVFLPRVTFKIWGQFIRVPLAATNLMYRIYTVYI